MEPPGPGLLLPVPLSSVCRVKSVILEVEGVARGRGSVQRRKTSFPDKPFRYPLLSLASSVPGSPLVERGPGKWSVSADLNKFRVSLCKKDRGNGYGLGG